MKRYEYGFITKDSNEIITVKGKGIKQAVKEFKGLFKDGKRFNGIRFLLKKAVIQLM